jgi:hypothetical protein
MLRPLLQLPSTRRRLLRLLLLLLLLGGLRASMLSISRFCWDEPGGCAHLVAAAPLLESCISLAGPVDGKQLRQGAAWA